MYSLVLAFFINGHVQAAHEIDNVQFKSAEACEIYKQRMQYKNTKTLKFTCTL